MGVIEEINKLHISVQTVAMAFLFIMPIWYIDIFLFANHFFSKNPFYVPIVFSFVLTTCWVIVSFAMSMLQMILLPLIRIVYYPHRPANETLGQELNEVEEMKLILSTGLTVGICLLSVFTALNYYEFNLGISKFILFSFLFVSFVVLLMFLSFVWLEEKKTKKVVNPTENT